MKNRIKVYLVNKTFKEVDMSDYTHITEEAFANRENISRLEFPEGVEVIGEYAFDHCVNLKEVIFPDTLERIEDRAFVDCVNLSLVECPKSAKIADTAFVGCVSFNGVTYR